MEILHKDDGKKGAFYVEQHGIQVAEMTYVWAGATKIIIDHTEVDESLKGLGVGKQLVEKAVMMAREKGLKIVPLCPFANATFKRMKEWQDVVN
ncbi:MAG: N-acetyltransferase [Chitinophagaceae bacterium]|uniref:GNAT family N-acetyltransferase n=1 Tax=unclassified Paraflavitalea TaxID=2798305 RepID=UPI003D33EC75|nr:N-acetyltransferase [Chitinophagaceae bacterium]